MRPRVHIDDGHVHCEGGTDPAVLDELESRGYDARPLASAQPLLRRRGGSRGAAGRGARTRPATDAAAASESSSVPDRAQLRMGAEQHPELSAGDGFVIRPAQPRDAAPLVALAADVASEPEGWLIADGGWRTVVDERRYLRAAAPLSGRRRLRRRDGGRNRRAALARARPAPGKPPCRRPRADGRRRLPPARHRPRLLDASPSPGRARQASASSSSTSFRTTSRRLPSTRASASAARATGRSTTAEGRTRRRDPDGLRRRPRLVSGAVSSLAEIAESFFRPAVRDLVPYEPGKPVEEVQRELGLERVVKLASNEGPFGPFPAALEALGAAAPRAQPLPGRRRLPAPHGARGAARRRASRRSRSAPGADGVIDCLTQASLDPGDEIVCGWPSLPELRASTRASSARRR